MVKDIVFIILVRGGSKSIKNKNLSLLGQYTLLEHAIIQAIESGIAKRIIVSSDSDILLQHAASFPIVELIKRPAELASDSSLSIDAQVHALKIKGITDHTMVMLLQVTSPFRHSIHICEAATILRRNGRGSVVSVRKNDHHPYKTFIVDGMRADGSLRVKPIVDFKSLSSPRQFLPDSYAINGAIYGNYADELIEANDYFIEPLNIFLMPEDLSLDIDTIEDLEKANKIYNRINQLS